MTGIEAGQLVHWSDMLAVRPELRDHGIGRRLKEFQRDALRTLGVTRIYWTFDPLVARNAHLNINRLGVEITEYAADMYGSETDSALHRGLGTDRFIAAWAITDARPGQSLARASARVARSARAALVVNPAGRDAAPATPDLDALLAHDTVRVEIPLDITRVQAMSIPLAGQWRVVTRAAFQCALEHGYRVAGFYRDAGARRAFYIVSRTLPSAGTP
ncbi:MAG TPA: hypothetical protein VFW98_08485 [Gemmatimonadaceae bacterium]|nr:hypothetical protein [Gemmatimonadaceae bacterium]